MGLAPLKFNISANKITIYAATSSGCSAFRRYFGNLASKSTVKIVSCSSLSFKIFWKLAIKACKISWYLSCGILSEDYRWLSFEKFILPYIFTILLSDSMLYLDQQKWMRKPANKKSSVFWRKFQKSDLIFLGTTFKPPEKLALKEVI